MRECRWVLQNCVIKVRIWYKFYDVYLHLPDQKEVLYILWTSANEMIVCCSPAWLAWKTKKQKLVTSIHLYIYMTTKSYILPPYPQLPSHNLTISQISRSSCQTLNQTPTSSTSYVNTFSKLPFRRPRQPIPKSSHPQSTSTTTASTSPSTCRHVRKQLKWSTIRCSRKNTLPKHGPRTNYIPRPKMRRRWTSYSQWTCWISVSGVRRVKMKGLRSSIEGESGRAIGVWWLVCNGLWMKVCLLRLCTLFPFRCGYCSWSCHVSSTKCIYLYQ